MAVLLLQGSLYLYHDDLSINAGKTLAFERDVRSSDTGFRLAYNPALFAGELTVDIDEDVLRLVLRIDVEDYLLGVVPYEMSDSFPLEALKAQAIAARTYALRKKVADKPFDLVDTTNDQVYYGYVAGYPNSERAVLETAGICGFFKGKLAQCYYSASNGGQTELPSKVWLTKEYDGSYAYGEDPYDIENPASLVCRYTIQKQYASDAPQSLRTLLSQYVGEKLNELGYDDAPESIRVDSVNALSLSVPDQEYSKLFTVLCMNVSLSGRTKTLAEKAEDSFLPLLAGEKHLPEVTILDFEETGDELLFDYSEYEEISEPFELRIPIFPDAEAAFGLDISANFDNEIWSVNENHESFIIEARRYGHGVGMSQRGAQWMALRYGKKYDEILSFYYPGIQLKIIPKATEKASQQDKNLTRTAGPALTPTPKPTLMPVSILPEKGGYYAVVAGIADNSTLNLRERPSQTAPILLRLQKGQRLLVNAPCEEQGWVKVRTDVIEGFVMEKYLRKE